MEDNGGDIRGSGTTQESVTTQVGTLRPSEDLKAGEYAERRVRSATTGGKRKERSSALIPEQEVTDPLLWVAP